VQAAVLVDGKRRGRRRQLVAPALSGGPLLYLRDRISGKNFLVDTGASRSLLPHWSSSPPTGPSLVGAGGRPIASWATVPTAVKFGPHSFNFPFLLAAVTKPILGNDFLRANKLLVDPARGCLVMAGCLSIISGVPAAGWTASAAEPVSGSGGGTAAPDGSDLVAALQHADPTIRHLLADFPAVLAADLINHKPLHGVEHVIETTGPPVFAKARRLDAEKLRQAKAEFQKLEAAGIIRRSKSQWASPLHMVQKKDGSWRPCGDFRRLNLVTKRDCYPLPNIQDLSSRLHGCTVFTTIDLVKGYHQVPVAEADIPKTAIITPFGLFEYVKMPFGLRNSAQTFQRLMDHLFSEYGFCFIYLDDILVASRSMEEHLHHLHLVFSKLQEAGLCINPEKCVFAQPQVSYLGHTVSAGGLLPLPTHVAAVQEFPAPTTVTQLQRFLGLINFYRRFLPGVAETLRPLTDALQGNPKSLSWSPQLQTAFEAAKAALVAAVPLHHPDVSAQLSLHVDASGSSIGGVLQQAHGRLLQPLAFYSRKLSPTEQRYSTFDRELLAAFAAVRHFRFMLEGRPFTLYTDHRPLTTALHRVSPPWSARQQRQLAYLAEFTSDLQHTPGKENVVADALSRVDCAVVADRPPGAVSPPDPATAAGVKAPSGSLACCQVADGTAGAPSSPGPGADSLLAKMAALQSTCKDVENMMASTSLNVQLVNVQGIPLLCSLSTGQPRPLVPRQLQRHVFELFHNVAHPGACATRRLLSSRYVWPRMAATVTEWARQCFRCQVSKTHRHVHVQPEQIPMPTRRFAHVHIDLVGPLPQSDGNTHILTIIDRSTRWPEAIPVPGTSARQCAEAFISSWVSRFGVPSTLTSDRGAQFTSAVWKSMCDLLHVDHVLTTAYHPQSNGLLERFHRRLKSALRARATSAHWSRQLPLILLHLRATQREDVPRSPAEAVYGSPIFLPGQLVTSPEPADEKFFIQLEKAMHGFVAIPARHNVPEGQQQPVDPPEELLQARRVFLRRDGVKGPLEQVWDGPYVVVSRARHVFKIQRGNKVEAVSVLRLKPAHVPDSCPDATPQRRGRPRKHVSFNLQPVVFNQPL